METPSAFRLNLLRSGYFLLAVGIGIVMWPQLITSGPQLEPMHGITLSLLCALGLLAVLGLRYPLQMLPLLIFELTWKALWLLCVFIPLWQSHRLTDALIENLFAVGIAIVFPFVIPWGYVLRQFVLRRGDPWRAKVKVG